ncbi:MAG: hypothetical protein J5I50_08530 [Chitinophagaceae bacterium]|nr:hypothetical protein [Chitinophagaceae bacterium]
MTLGQQSYKDSFSSIYDPLPDLKHWLEAISVGVQQTSFEYDNEGQYIRYNFEKDSVNNGVFTISENMLDEDDVVFAKGLVDRRQLVKAFYLGLLTFADSDKFVSEKWEVEYLKERLCKIMKIEEEALIAQLAELDNKELGQGLFNADPIYSSSFRESKDKKEEWNIPDEYNYWATEKKREFVIECCESETYKSCGGSKIADFRSPIIEKYLDEG